MPFSAEFNEKFCRETLPEACTIVIFGASGNLAEKKIFPALESLRQKELLHPRSRIVAVFRRGMSFEEFCRKADITSGLAARLSVVRADFEDMSTIKALARHLDKTDELSDIRRRIYYFALPPSAYRSAVGALHECGMLNEPDARYFRCAVLEKPLGYDLDDVKNMRRFLSERLAPERIYLIDHYLGKDDVQNILMLRFANKIFSGVWNNHCISKFTVGVSERAGIGSRAGYFDRAGIVRDMFQSHLLLMLGFCLMPRPEKFDAPHINRELVRVLRNTELENVRFAGQYEGYLQEPGVSANSSALTCSDVTFVNRLPEWNNVSMRLFAGKAMREERTFIRVAFKSEPLSFLELSDVSSMPGNELELELKPSSGIRLVLCSKQPGPHLCLGTLSLQHSSDKQLAQDGYMRLLLDCQNADRTFFPDFSVFETTGALCDRIIETSAQKSVKIYSRGTLDFSSR